MNRVLKILCLLSLLVNTVQAANIVASLDRDPVLLDESFRLVLEADDTVDAEPDFSVLLKDFEILSQSKSANMTFVNGAFSRKSVWNLALIGKRPGTFTIPSIPFGRDRSPALRITIKDPATAPNTGVNNREIYLESEIDMKSSWVQAPVIYTLRLYSAVSLTNLRASELKTSDPDAVIEQLGEVRTYEAFRGGTRYAVREIRYVIYPQRSGKLDIEPVIFEGRVSQGGPRSIFDQYLSTGELKRLRSKAVSLEVRPRPPGIDASHWLPANEVRLSEQWSADAGQLRAGEPVTRTITIHATGPLANTLPDLQLPDIDGLKQYPDKPQLVSKATDRGVSSSKQIKIALIPTRAGEFRIPPLSLHWFNVATGQQETAMLPASVIRATGAPATMAPPPPVTAPAEPGPQAVETATPLPAPTVAAGSWPWISLALGTGWLITLVALLRTRKRTALPTHKPRAAALKPLETEVRRQCQANDPRRTRDALLAWARAKWPTARVASLNDIARLGANGLDEPLRRLDAALYSAGPAEWHGGDLLKAFDAMKKSPEKADKSSAEALEPLYKS